MKAIIMAGGKGQRLRPLTSTQPKPLVPVCGVPVLVRSLRLLRQNDILEAVIAAGCFRAQIEALCGSECEGVRLHYTEEQTPLGTAGSVKAAEKFLLDGDFFVLSGDALCEFDLKRAAAFHRENHAEVTMLLTGMEDPTEYGIVLTDPDLRVCSFLEKPDISQAFTDTINTGIYLLSPAVLAEIPEGIPTDFGHELFPKLVRQGRRVFGLRDSGYWSDIGSPEAYLAANLRYAAMDHISLPKGCTDSVIGKGCRIGDGAEVKNSVLMEGVSIGAGTSVCGAVLCRNVQVGAGCRIAEHAVLGEGARLGDGVLVGYGVRLDAGAEADPGTVLKNAADAALPDRLFNSGVFSGTDVLLSPALCQKIGEAAAAVLKKSASDRPKIGVMHAGGARQTGTISRALVKGIEQGGGSCVRLGAGFLRAAASAAPTMELDGVFFVCSDRFGNTSVTLLDRYGLRPGRLTERPMLAFLRQARTPEAARNTGNPDSRARANTSEKTHNTEMPSCTNEQCRENLPPTPETQLPAREERNSVPFLMRHYGPALKRAAGDLTGIRVSVAAHRDTSASSASGVLTGILTEAGADVSEDAPLRIDLEEDGCDVRLTEGETEADLSHILAMLLIARPELFREPLAFSCEDSEELYRIASRLGYACGRFASCPSGREDDAIREEAAASPVLRDAPTAVLALLSLQKESGETLAGLSELLPPFVRKTGRIPAHRIRASAVRQLGKPDGDGVYREAEGGGVRVVPERGGYRLVAEAYSAEYADELLAETGEKLKKLLERE